MQRRLFKEPKVSLEHGGSLMEGKRKGKRPLSVSKPMHLVFRSDAAIGKLSLTKYEEMIKAILKETADKFFVKVYKLAINRNHLHLCVKGQEQQSLKSFLKVFAGVLAKKMIFITKSKLTKFWSLRVYSRIVHWGKDYKNVFAYIEMNEKEASGEVPYTPRKRQKKKTCGFPSERHQNR